MGNNGTIGECHALSIIISYECYCLVTVWNRSDILCRDRPNSREKMHDFTVEFLKCVKFHGKFTEEVSNDAKLSIVK